MDVRVGGENLGPWIPAYAGMTSCYAGFFAASCLST